MSVQGISFLAHTLEHATIQQDFTAIVQGEQMLGTGNAAGSAMEGYFHQTGFA
jgi:hypothetical protein